MADEVKTEGAQATPTATILTNAKPADAQAQATPPATGPNAAQKPAD